MGWSSHNSYKKGQCMCVESVNREYKEYERLKHKGLKRRYVSYKTETEPNSL